MNTALGALAVGEGASIQNLLENVSCEILTQSLTRSLWERPLESSNATRAVDARGPRRLAPEPLLDRFPTRRDRGTLEMRV